MNEINWQPDFSGNGYGPTVRLKGELATELQEKDVPDDYRKNFNDFVKDEIMGEQYREHMPVRFYGDTFLASSIHLGNNGTWIAADSISDRQRGEKLEYYPHNVDTAEESQALLKIFGEWADKAPFILEE